MRSITLAAALMAVYGAALTGHAAEPDGQVPDAQVKIEEWTVPYEDTRPRDPYVAPDGSVWFAGQGGHYLGRFDPETEKFTKIDLADEPGPHNLIVARNGALWYAGNLNGYIGRYEPGTGTLEKVVMPDDAALDPHTLVFGPEEKTIWFTVQGGNFIGRLTIDGRAVDLISVPTPNARPYGIKVGPGGRVYVALFGTNKIATVDPKTLELTEHALPGPHARPRRLEVTGEGTVYYTDYARGYLGRLDVESGEAREWPMPAGGDSRPYGSALDGHGRIWAVETGVSPNRLVGFNPETQTFFSRTDVPSGGGTVRHMYYDAQNGAIWFGTDTNTLARVKVPAP